MTIPVSRRNIMRKSRAATTVFIRTGHKRGPQVSPQPPKDFAVQDDRQDQGGRDLCDQAAKGIKEGGPMAARNLPVGDQFGEVRQADPITGINTLRVGEGQPDPGDVAKG